MTERVLPFNRGIVAQDTGYWCGPATAQNILADRGISVNESVLAREMGTTEDGTNHIGLVRDALSRRLPEAHYTVVQLPNDPPTVAQRTKLWWDVIRSIDNGFPVAVNIVVPPSNYPRGVKGSPNPRYGGGTVYHYLGVFGWSDEGNNGRPSVYIVDSGFSPYAYWVDFDQFATMIPPKGYAFADLPVIAPALPGAQVPPGIPVADAAPTPPPPELPPVVIPAPSGLLTDPFTDTLWSPNRYHPRTLGIPGWIVVHTQEGGRDALGLAQYTADPDSEVSYHGVLDDKRIFKTVAEDDAPWSAAGANQYAFHVCAAGSYSGWSRDKWLETDAADGKNEDLELTNMAKVVAWWCQKYDIPAVWIGGRNRPPWGLRGVCGHVDLAAWGGGHGDPGGNFPVVEFMRRVTGLLTNTEQPPLVTLPPVVLPGTNPDAYGDWLIYRQKPGGNNPDRVERVQRRLKAMFDYAKHLPIDRDYSWSDDMVVREFQKNSHLVVDGIVGPATAAALKP